MTFTEKVLILIKMEDLRQSKRSHAMLNVLVPEKRDAFLRDMKKNLKTLNKKKKEVNSKKQNKKGIESTKIWEDLCFR